MFLKPKVGMHGINQPRASILKPLLVSWWSRSLLVLINISLSLLLLVREFSLLSVLCGMVSYIQLQQDCLLATSMASKQGLSVSMVSSTAKPSLA